jgi:hypothetical protein
MARPKAPPITFNRQGRRIADKQKTMEIIIESLRRGMSIEGACSSAGICAQTYYNWRNASPDFGEEADRAIGDAESLCIDVIRQDASWQSKAWLLERRFPDRYARKVRTDDAATVAPTKIKLTWSPETEETSRELSGEEELVAAAEETKH